MRIARDEPAQTLYKRVSGLQALSLIEKQLRDRFKVRGYNDDF
jgi:hypothetical protein